MAMRSESSSFKQLRTNRRAKLHQSDDDNTGGTTAERKISTVRSEAQADDESQGESGPDVVGYLKQMVSLTVSLNGTDPHLQPPIGAPKSAHELQNLFHGAIGGRLREAQKEMLGNYIRDAVAVICREADQVIEHVIQVHRKHTNLKRKKSQAVISLKGQEAKKGRKKCRLVSVARSEAAHRKNLACICRQFGDVLEQIMRHRSYSSFDQLIDVSGSSLRNYKEGRGAFVLEDIRDEIKVKDGQINTNIREMYEDVKSIFKNAMQYSTPGSELYRHAKILMEKFEEKWSILEPKLTELEEKRNQEQGISDFGVDQEALLKMSRNKISEEASLRMYSSRISDKLEKIENDLEDFIRTVTTCNRPMTPAEKDELVQKISQLPSSGLNRVQEIVCSGNKSSDFSREEFYIDLDKEAPEILWRLYIYLQTVLQAGNEPDKGMI